MQIHIVATEEYTPKRISKKYAALFEMFDKLQEGESLKISETSKAETHLWRVNLYNYAKENGYKVTVKSIGDDGYLITRKPILSDDSK